jgi:hypothetical protein
MSEGCSCKDCRRVRERVASLLPFKIVEAAAGKPLRISGVAIAAGLSRNLNLYTPQELEAFASQLVNAPMYIEHVAVPNAIGKVTKAFFDSASRCLMYEAEVYDEAIAEKIRKGLIQHVSVGADYDALDVVDAKVPHGLHNAELSLVAVPGIPEANIQVLERLLEHVSGHKSSVKEKIGEDEQVFCVFCGKDAEFFVSICPNCFEKFSVGASETQSMSSSIETAQETNLDKLTEKIVTKIDKNIAENKKLSGELSEAKVKLSEAEEKSMAAEAASADLTRKLAAANQAVEDLRKQLPGSGLLKDPPKMMLVSEALSMFESVLPVPMVERSAGLGMQRVCQEIRGHIFRLRERQVLKGASSQ